MTRRASAAFPAWAVVLLCALLFHPKAEASYGTTPRATLALNPNTFGQPTTFGSVGSLGYDLAGRVNSMSTAADTTTQSYVDGQPDVETHTAGVLKGQSVDRDYDTLGRLWKVKLPGDVTIIYSYDTATGALSGVTTAGGASGTWSNFDPVTGKAKNFTLGPLTVTGSFDGLGRVTSHASTAAGVTTSYGYGWDDDGHCSSVSGPNGAWTLGYSNHGYLESATGWKNYTYSFDEAGRPANATDWHPTVRLNSSVIDVFGSVTPGATLTINSGTVAVDGTTGRFSASYTPTLGTWQTYVVRGTVVGAGNNGTDAVAEEVRNIFVSPASENLGYDLSGNLSSDARWTQGWNDLDQLANSEETTPLSSSTKTHLEYLYDLQGRRVQTKVSVGGTVIKRTTTLWDGWLQMMDVEYNGGNYELARRYYTWGPDVSGRLDGAAGIGGLIEIFEKRGTTTTRNLPINDGIGNVVRYVDGTTGARVATFSYGPFGEVIEAWGERASSCIFRYQTKRYDQETGYSYFGKRYLEPKTGWLSRDPLREDGGINLYAYAGNNPIASFDPVGLEPVLMVRNSAEYERIKKLQELGTEGMFSGVTLIPAFDRDGEKNPVFTGRVPLITLNGKRYGQGGRIVGTEGAWFFDSASDHKRIHGAQAQMQWLGVLFQVGTISFGAGTGSLTQLGALPSVSSYRIITTQATEVQAVTAPFAQRRAIIMQHQGTPTHFSIEIEGGAHTHQVFMTPTATRIMTAQRADPGPILRQVDFTLDNIASATRQSELLGIENLGPYDKITNSCVSHVCDVLEAGGIDVPPAQGSAQLKFLLDAIKKRGEQ